MTREEVEDVWKQMIIWGSGMPGSAYSQIGKVFQSWLTLEQRNRELEKQDEVHWKTRRTLLADRDKLQAEKAQLQSDMDLAYGAAQAEIAKLKEEVQYFKDIWGEKNVDVGPKE